MSAEDRPQTLSATRTVPKRTQRSAMDALARSKSLMDGHRMDLFIFDEIYYGANA